MKVYIFYVFMVFCTAFSISNSQNVVNNPNVILQYIEKSPIMYVMEELKDTILPKDQSKNLVENNFYRLIDGKEIIVLEYDEAIFRDELFKKAEAEFESKNYKEALNYYKKLYDKFPDYAAAQTKQAKCIIKLNNSDDAIDLLRSAISQNYIDYEAHKLLAKLYADMDLIDVAVRYITTAHILNRNDKEINDLRVELFTKKDLRTDNWAFTPQVKYDASSKEVMIYTKEQYQFYAYADALWTYDKDYLKTKTIPESPYNLNRLQETILAHSIALQKVPWYSTIVEGATLKFAFEKMLINEFIYYEIILPQFPDEAQKLSEDQINKLVNYVLTIRGELK